MDIKINNKDVYISVHAIKRPRERDVVYPDQVYNVLMTGKIKKFAKNHIKIIKKFNKGSIICIGEDLGECIIIKTIQRGK